MTTRYPKEIIDAARALYLNRHSISEIRTQLKIGSERVIYQWKEAGEWDRLLAFETAEQAITRRVILLAERDPKSAIDIEELERLTAMLTRFEIDKARADKIRAEADALRKQGGECRGDTSKGAGPARKKKGKAKKNDISGITKEALDEFARKTFYEYQLLWREKSRDPQTRRNRFILKARQIGATWYFSFEAFEDATLSGDNQIFISASRDQAEVFRGYIIAFAIQFGVELTGNPIVLSNGAELRFVSTNIATAQSYHGHLYQDEIYWIPGDFKRFHTVSSGMAAHKKWRRTSFSVPSSVNHGAHDIFGGANYNKGKSDKKKVTFDLSHDNLKDGWLGPDKIWRHMVTVEDAERQGCDLFDIAELRNEYGPDEFANLFMCRFIDEAKSVFSLEALLACTRDKDTWTHIQYGKNRPLENRPVAFGYDPSRTRDDGKVALLEIPLRPTDKWRLFHHLTFRNKGFHFQADSILQESMRYKVIHCGVDITAIGWGVFEILEKEGMPGLMPIHYSQEIKNQLVIRAQGIIGYGEGRFEYSTDDIIVTQSFMTIHRQMTRNGSVSYSAHRTDATGHADLSWAIMHGFAYEPVSGPKPKSTVAFSN